MARATPTARLHRFTFERSLLSQATSAIAGVDEAGRGPLAGPVVAAAVVLPTQWICDGLPANLRGLNDSKQLTSFQRDEFYAALVGCAEVRWALGEADAATVDQLNILRATHAAIAQALSRLYPPPDHVLVDGHAVPALDFPQTALIKGDSRSFSIAAASVLAKVTRDRQMIEFDCLYPAYGFATHKGYGTPEHLSALRRHGPCPIHRRSFAPLKPAQAELFTDVALVAAPLDR
jgi:ribonuclease HII